MNTITKTASALSVILLMTGLQGCVGITDYSPEGGAYYPPNYYYPNYYLDDYPVDYYSRNYYNPNDYYYYSNYNTYSPVVSYPYYSSSALYLNSRVGTSVSYGHRGGMHHHGHHRHHR